jgi:hypothetical protein
MGSSLQGAGVGTASRCEVIVVIADSPGMGATYRMPEALAPLARDGQVKTIVRQRDSWREWGADVVLPLVDDAPWQLEKLVAATTLTERADWLLVMGMTGMDTLHDVTGGILPKAPMVVYHPESFYRGERAADFNRFCDGLVAATFAMPDLWAGGHCPPGTVPLLQPMIVPAAPPVPTQGLYIVHSPGTAKKAVAKGSETIADGIALAAEHIGRGLDYRCILDASHEETLAQKAIAHICIDQVPPDGYPAGLGNAGCEGLALACHTISRYEADTSAYFPNPPVVAAHNAADVAEAIVDYARSSTAMQERKRRRAWEWATDNLAFEPWRAYLWTHLPAVVRARSVTPTTTTDSLSSLASRASENGTPTNERASSAGE